MPIARLPFHAWGLSLLIGGLYFLTLWGSDALLQKADALAFADTAHYVELLDGHLYRDCLADQSACTEEYRRKAVHHYSYMVLGGLFVSIAGLLSAASALPAIWSISPVLGALNFLLAYTLLSRESGRALALPGALAMALLPSIWIYSSIAETWILANTGVLLFLLMRRWRTPLWAIAIITAVFALNNFLLLALVLLLDRPEDPFLQRFQRMAMLGVSALLAWLLLLWGLGTWVAADFAPLEFLQVTAGFKEGMPENLGIAHPGRWIYSGFNGWLLPFVLNQSQVNFSYMAWFDSARNLPLGTLAVACQLGLLASIGRMLWTQWYPARDGSPPRWQRVAGPVIFLALMYVLETLALYYETFLYSPMIVSVVMWYALKSLHGYRRASAMTWLVAIILIANATQQLWVYRSLLVA